MKKLKLLFFGDRIESFEALNKFFIIDNIVTTQESRVYNKLKNQTKYNIDTYSKDNVDTIYAKYSSLKDTILFSCGFKYKLPLDFISKFECKLNSHPAILPRDPGSTPIRKRFNENPNNIFGATLHHINKDIDQGEIIHQIEFVNKNFNLKELHNFIFQVLEPKTIIQGLKKINLINI